MAETRILSLTPANRSLVKGLRVVAPEVIENHSQILSPLVDPPRKIAVELAQGEASRGCTLDFFGSRINGNE